MSNTATRLITLLMLLQRKQNQKASDLAKELGVSIRTVHRYIAMLEEIGIPIYSERGRNGGFSLVRGYKMPPLVFTPEESVAIYLGTSLVEEMWGKLYSSAARGVLAKLDNVLPEEQRHEVAWARKTLLATGMHRADFSDIVPLLEKIRRATRERRIIEMIYRSRNQLEPTRRQVDLYVLIHRWGWWYAIGYCHLRNDMRSFRIDRILELTLLKNTFEVPPQFDIHSYLESEPYMRPQMIVRIRFSPQAAIRAYDDRAYWQNMLELYDGSVEVTFEVPNVEWAVSTILSFGEHVTVMEPLELRPLIKARSLKIAENYKNID